MPGVRSGYAASKLRKQDLPDQVEERLTGDCTGRAVASWNMEHASFRRGDLNALKREDLGEPFTRTQLAGFLRNDVVEASEVLRMIGKEVFQLVFQARALRCWCGCRWSRVPLFLDRLPKLLRNPEDVVAHERPAGETIGQDSESLACKSTKGVSIKSVARSNKQARAQAFCAQDFEAGTNPLALLRFFRAREFRFLMQAEEGLAATGAKVAIAMHGD